MTATGARCEVLAIHVPVQVEWRAQSEWSAEEYDMTPIKTADVHDAAFDALVRYFGDRALVAMTVMFCESSFRPSIRNGSGAAYYGINQMGTAELSRMGLTPLIWLSMPAEQQIPYVARFWQDKVGRFGDWLFEAPENLYGCNFLPGRCTPGMPRDKALTAKGMHDYLGKDGQWHSFYEANPDLDVVNGHLLPDATHRYDVGKDGQIDLEDFAAWIALRKSQEPGRWGELAARLAERQGTAEAPAIARITPVPLPPTLTIGLATDDEPGPEAA
jgi:hypothetical protein